MNLILIPLGYYLADENFSIIDSIDFNPIDAANEYYRIDKGEYTENLERILKRSGKSTLKVFNRKIFEILKEKKYNVELSEDLNDLFSIKAIREGISKRRFKNIDEYYSFIKDFSTELTKLRIREEQQTRDKLIIQTIDSIDELDKITNILVSRLNEWYGLYFPELYKILNDNELFSKILSKICLKGEMNEQNLKEFMLSEDKLKRIIDASKHSIGGEFPEEDLYQIKEIAKLVRSLYERRKALEKYLDQLMEEIAPNINAITGPTIGARLIAKAGGLKRLAELPASTIQVLGAEKALFKHLKFGAKPPKHGILFQHPLVHSAQKWNRGKIARLLANKIAMASKLDFYGQKSIAESLKKEIEERVELIKKTYTKPKKKMKRK